MLTRTGKRWPLQLRMRTIIETMLNENNHNERNEDDDNINDPLPNTATHHEITQAMSTLTRNQQYEDNIEEFIVLIKSLIIIRNEVK